MTAKVFLSLSHVDEQFVADVHGRLPKGLAYFYKESFENGDILIDAMERAVSDAAIFVLFVSEKALESKGVLFEIDQARINLVFGKGVRVLVFPISSNVRYTDLPKWMQSRWIESGRWEASDIARYITISLLEPDVGVANVTRVIGRGKTEDRIGRLSAHFLSRRNRQPNVYIFGGFTGIGRRTFAAYFMRRALSADINLPYGPKLHLSPQSDALDLYRALRTEISVRLSISELTQDQAAFQESDLKTQISEIIRLLQHFTELGQAVTITSTSGFLEDRGTPKDWVAALLKELPPECTLFLVTNRLFPEDFVEELGNAIQTRIEELDDDDIHALMIFTASRLKIKDFLVSRDLVKAIGGHPDVANAAVRLVSTRGGYILERDPRLLFNIQKTILGEAINTQYMTPAEKAVLDVLSWFPEIGGDLLEEIVLRDKSISTQEFFDAIERLLLSCLITGTTYTYSIAGAIRQLYRRWNTTPKAVLRNISEVISAHWEQAEREGKFREDIFSVCVFMHAIEGLPLPKELADLLSPGTLYDVVRTSYARGREEDNTALISRAISWGQIAKTMKMSEAVREEILSTVALAQIRLGKPEALETIDFMSGRGYRSALFLRGHHLRKREDYDDAIALLKGAVRENKYKRSAVHELALCYKKTQKFDALRSLLDEHGALVRDSAMFTDFQIGIDLAQRDLSAAADGIRRLRSMPDENGRADKRQAQLFMREGRYKSAKDLLSHLISTQNHGGFHYRSLRANAAAQSGDYDLAQKDIDFIKGLPGRESTVLRLEALLNCQTGNLAEAESKLKSIRSWTPEDWLLSARILDRKAEASHSLSERQELQEEAAKIRAKYNSALEFDYED